MTITTREQAIEDLGMFGIEKPQIYMLHIIPLVEMIWAEGVVQESELAILNDSLRKRVPQVDAMAGYKVMDTEMLRHLQIDLLSKNHSRSS